MDPVEVYGTVLVLRCERCEERYGLPEAGTLIGASRTGCRAAPPPAAATPCGRRGPCGARPSRGRRWSGRGSSPPTPTRSSSSTPTCGPPPSASSPSVPSPAGCRSSLVGETPTQYDRYAARVVRAPSAGVITAVADLIAPVATVTPAPRWTCGSTARRRSSPAPPPAWGRSWPRGLAGAGCAVVLAARRADRLDARSPGRSPPPAAGPSPTAPTCATPPTPPSWWMHACMHSGGWTGWC